MLKKTIKRWCLCVSSILTCLCLVFGVMALLPISNVSAAIDGSLGNSVTLNKIQATNGITASGTTNEYVSFDMGVKGSNVWIMTQFTGKNAPNYAMNAKASGSATWTSANTSYDDTDAGVLLTNSSEYNAEYLQVFNTTNTVVGQARANLGTGKDAGLKNLVDGQEYIQIIGYENSGDNSRAKITYYLFEVNDGALTLAKSIVPTEANCATYSFRTDGQYVVLYGNIQSTGITSNPDGVTFEYAKPASTLAEMMKGVSDYYTYKDNLVAALNIQGDVSEEVSIPEKTTLKNEATLSSIDADASGNAASVENITFDGFSGETWFITQFTGKNAPNYAVRSYNFSAWQTSNSSAANYTGGANSGALITNSARQHQRSMRMYYNSNTFTDCRGSIDGSWNNGPGLEYYTDGQEYIQIIGYSQNATTNTSADVKIYNFKITNGAATLVFENTVTGANCWNGPKGSTAVLYGNIHTYTSAGVDVSAGGDSVTFSYQAPANSLTLLLKGVSDYYAYKDDIVAALNIQEDVSEENVVVAAHTLRNNVSLNKIQATNGITATGTSNQFVSFDMGVKGGNVWIMTQFTGKNAPNYAMNAKASGSAVWTSANTTYNDTDAGVLLTNSSEYNAEYLQVFNTTNTVVGQARANLGSGKDAGLKNLVDGQEYIQIIGYENSGDNSRAKITYYLFEVNDGVATLAKSIVPTTGNGGAYSFRTDGQYVVLYGNIQSTGITNNPDGVEFSYQAPKTTLDDLINSLANRYAYKDDIAAALNITIDTTEPGFGDVMLKDMANNTLKTLVDVTAVKLPYSTLSDFVGWYNEANGQLYKAGDIVPVKADTSFVELSAGIALEDGAAVRLKNDTLGIGGLRFEAVISKTVVDLLGANIVFKGAIIPTDLLTGDLTLETANARSIELVNKKEIDGAYHAYITLTSIKLENFERAYSARAFAVVTYADGTTATIASAYDQENNSRSVYYVAASAYSSGNYGEHSVLKYYLNNAVNVAFRIEEGLYEITASHDYDGLSETFERGYTVSNVVIDGTEVTFDVALADATYSGDMSVKFWSNAKTSEVKIVSFVNGSASVSFICNDLIPNYLNSDGEFTYWAYSATCGDYYQINNTKYYQDANGTQLSYNANGENAGNVLVATNDETVQLYADAGFNVMFINWGATAYNTPIANYETYFDRSVVKTIMDYAWEHQIKCFVYQGSLNELSRSETSVIVGNGKGDGVKTFDTQADLNAFAEKMLYGIKDHPAFYGVSLVDEPSFKQFDAISEVYQAVQSVAPGAFCNINLHPMNYDYRAMAAYNQDSYDKYNGKTGTVDAPTMEAAYKDYLNLYYEKVGKYCGYIQYDSYPMIKYNGNYFLYTHIRNAQIVAELCTEKGMRFGHVYQTYKDAASTGRRAIDKDDIEWQLNFGMAMGVKDHSYYTYYPVLNDTALPDEDYTFVDRAGNPNNTYYSVKDLHGNMAVMAKALAHFEYRGMKYYTKGNVDSMENALDIVDNTGTFDDKMSGVAISANGVVLTTELYDEEGGRYGYFVMNATNPYEDVVPEQAVTLSFSGYRNVQVYQDGVITNYSLTNGAITLTLAEAAGAFVIPY